jgi:lysophospholipase L1-like esterase
MMTMRFYYFVLCALGFTVSFAQPATTLPPHSKVLFFGDSHTSYGYGVRDYSVQYQNNGYAAWVNLLAPGIQIPKEGLLGVPGETTVQMVKRLQPISASNAKVLVVLAGTNDILRPVDTVVTKANLRTIYNTAKASGMRVIAIPILPHFSPPNIWAVVEEFRQDVNAWIRAQPDVTVVDPEPDLSNASFYEDGIHLTPAGGLILGKKVADVLNSWVASCVPGSGEAGQWRVAANGNPMLAGTGGTKKTASGSVANNWELSGTWAGGATVTGSKEASGSGEKQVIKITGSYSGSSRRATFINYAALPIQLKGSDVVEGVAEVEIPATMQGVRSVYLKVTALNDNYQQTLGEGHSLYSTSGFPMLMPTGKLVLRTPPITISNSAAVANLFTEVTIELAAAASSTPVSATLKFSSIGIRKLPLATGSLASITPAGQQTLCAGSPLSLQASGVANNGHYQWQLNNAPISGQTASSLLVSQAGTYAVAVSTPGCVVLSAPVTVVADCACTPPYRFTGNGHWSNPANWLNGNIPPTNLPPCAEIIIEPMPGGECVLSTAINLRYGHKLRVLSGRKLRVQ